MILPMHSATEKSYKKIEGCVQSRNHQGDGNYYVHLLAMEHNKESLICNKRVPLADKQTQLIKHVLNSPTGWYIFAKTL